MSSYYWHVNESDPPWSQYARHLAKIILDSTHIRNMLKNMNGNAEITSAIRKPRLYLPRTSAVCRLRW